MKFTFNHSVPPLTFPPSSPCVSVESKLGWTIFAHFLFLFSCWRVVFRPPCSLMEHINDRVSYTVNRLSIFSSWPVFPAPLLNTLVLSFSVRTPRPSRLYTVLFTGSQWPHFIRGCLRESQVEFRRTRSDRASSFSHICLSRFAPVVSDTHSKSAVLRNRLLASWRGCSPIFLVPRAPGGLALCCARPRNLDCCHLSHGAEDRISASPQPLFSPFVPPRFLQLHGVSPRQA